MKTRPHVLWIDYIYFFFSRLWFSLPWKESLKLKTWWWTQWFYLSWIQDDEVSWRCGWDLLDKLQFRPRHCADHIHLTITQQENTTTPSSLPRMKRRFTTRRCCWYVNLMGGDETSKGHSASPGVSTVSHICAPSGVIWQNICVAPRSVCQTGGAASDPGTPLYHPVFAD